MKKLDEAHKEFIEHLKNRKRASATILAYGKDIEQLIGFLEELQKAHVHEITADDIKSFLAKLTNTGYTPKSVSRKLNSTKTFFRFLKVQEYITDDPANLVDHPKFDTKPPRILTPTEYRALRDAARDDIRIAAIIEILLLHKLSDFARLYKIDLSRLIKKSPTIFGADKSTRSQLLILCLFLR